MADLLFVSGGPSTPARAKGTKQIDKTCGISGRGFLKTPSSTIRRACEEIVEEKLIAIGVKRAFKINATS